jgi:aldehyde dehydrogenase (NAD+)
MTTHTLSPAAHWIGGETVPGGTETIDVVNPATNEVIAAVPAGTAAAEYTVGDPAEEGTRIGPLASQAQRQRVTGYIERGIADGATVAFGGPGPVEGLEAGAYVRPTIFARVDPNAVIAQEEIFGPVLSVIP